MPSQYLTNFHAVPVILSPVFFGKGIYGGVYLCRIKEVYIYRQAVMVCRNFLNQFHSLKYTNKMAQFNKINGYFIIKTGQNTSVETTVLLSRLDYSAEGIKLSFYSVSEFQTFDSFLCHHLPVFYLMEIHTNYNHFYCTIPAKFISQFEIK